MIHSRCVNLLGPTTTRSYRLYGVLTVLATFVVFLPSLANGFVWDDSSLILHNANVQSKPLSEVWLLRLWDASGVSESSLNPIYADVYRPWITFCYALTFRLFGADALAFHAINLAVHLCTTALAFLWLSGRARSASPVVVTMATLLFALHPTKTESVAWISGSTDVWMGFFVLAALVTRQRASGTARFLLLALTSTLGMFSKETFIVLLAWMLTEDYLASSLRQHVRDYLASVLGIATALSVRAAVLSGSDGSLLARLTTDLAGLGAIASSYGHYLRQTVLFYTPTIQPSYKHYVPGGTLVLETWSVVLGALFLIAVTALAVRNLRKPPRWPEAFLGAWLYFLFLLPVSNLLQLDTESLTADRFLYMPTLSLSLLTLFAFNMIDRSSGGALAQRWRFIAAMTTAVVCIAFGAVAKGHIATFANEKALHKNALRHDPKNLYAIVVLAGMEDAGLARQMLVDGQKLAILEGRYGLALQCSLKAMQVLAKETADLDQATLGQLFDAYKTLDEEGTLAFQHPSMRLHAKLSTPLHQQLKQDVSNFLYPWAAVASRMGKVTRAEALLLSAMQIRPNDGQLRADHALLLARRDEWKEAGHALDVAERKLPGDARLAGARRILTRANALRDAISMMSEQERALATVYVPLSLSALPDARTAYLDLWAKSGATPPLLEAAVQVELADRQPLRAHELLERARAERPDLEQHWLRIEERLQQVRIERESTVW